MERPKRDFDDAVLYSSNDQHDCRELALVDSYMSDLETYADVLESRLADETGAQADANHLAEVKSLSDLTTETFTRLDAAQAKVRELETTVTNMTNALADAQVRLGAIGLLLR